MRWALLCAVAFGVLGMHHLPGPVGHGPAVSVSVEHHDAPAHDGDLWGHACLAVLVAAVGFGLLVLLGRRPAQEARPGGQRVVAHGSPRSPPRPRLAMLCVLRQ
ncbi:hypothetical protein CLV40_11087 [Actinokineospora auranticolor]|uniref:Uncharacterized protein n=1 Tax=Actinokineospora auranticolor TaxID=155976 RepID=A0A2S6GMI3_9PSEU|nr:hypothetical protein CLV40_11087 [Actinokineospora auranticolor]